MCKKKYLVRREERREGPSSFFFSSIAVLSDINNIKKIEKKTLKKQDMKTSLRSSFVKYYDYS